MTSPLTEQQLADIDARRTAATPGPWEEHVGTLAFGDGEDAAADREFVQHAREDVDALLAEVRRLRAAIETGTGPCGHDDYHDAHEWADRPGVWCPGHSHATPAAPAV